jgi:hypothetical protein
MTERNFKAGEYIFSITAKRLYYIDNVREDEKVFSYYYFNDSDDKRYSSWVEFEDKWLVKMFNDGDVIHITSDQELLAIKLKYSGAM